MEIIKPITFASSMLLSTNATESVTAWNAGTTYAVDAEVNYSNSIYVSLVGSNLNFQPDINPTKWIRKSANNTYNMFDEFVNSQTTRTGALTVSVKPGSMVNSFAVLNTENCTNFTIQGTDGVGGPVVFSETVQMDDTIIVDWYMYFFEPYDLKDQYIVKNIPPYQDIVLNCTFNTTSTVKIGNFVFGSIYPLGLTQIGASAGIRDYSVKKVNDFGIVTFVQRAFSKRMEVQLYVPNTDLNYVQKILQDLRSTPIVWIGTDDLNYGPLTMFGYYKDFNLEISYPSVSMCSIEVEGII